MIEYIDILSDQGVHLNKFDTKENVHKYGYWHNTAHVWILNFKNEILIQKRNHLRETFAGFYDVSVAGHISSGESIENGALREIKEEMGINVDIGDLKFLFREKNSSFLNNNTYINNEFFNVFLIKKDIPIENFKIQEEEVEEIKFISIGDFIDELKSNPKKFANRGEYYEKSINFIVNSL